jgi:hypothetical protein
MNGCNKLRGRQRANARKKSQNRQQNKDLAVLEHWSTRGKRRHGKNRAELKREKAGQKQRSQWLGYVKHHELTLKVIVKCGQPITEVLMTFSGSSHGQNLLHDHKILFAFLYVGICTDGTKAQSILCVYQHKAKKKYIY